MTADVFGFASEHEVAVRKHKLVAWSIHFIADIRKYLPSSRVDPYGLWRGDAPVFLPRSTSGRSNASALERHINWG